MNFLHTEPAKNYVDFQGQINVGPPKEVLISNLKALEHEVTVRAVKDGQLHPLIAAISKFVLQLR
jgi:hypothetical protein